LYTTSSNLAHFKDAIRGDSRLNDEFMRQLGIRYKKMQEEKAVAWAKWLAKWNFYRKAIQEIRERLANIYRKKMEPLRRALIAYARYRG